MKIKSDAKEVINRLAKHIISEIKKAKGVEFDTFLFFSGDWTGETRTHDINCSV